jgi:integrase
LRWPPCPEHRQAAPGELDHIAPLERDRGTVRRAEPARRPALGRSCLAAAARAQEQAAVTRNVLDRLIATCATDRLADTRDLAILLLAFASGGRRRSEVARLRVEQLRDEPRRVSIRAIRNRPRYHASQFSLAGPRRATSTRRAGCFWSALRARRCANGWSGPTSRRGRFPGGRPLGSG